MQASQQLNLLAAQTLDACVFWMGVQRHLGLHEPLAKRFRVNGKQVATLLKRKIAHEKNSFRNITMRTRWKEGIPRNPREKHWVVSLVECYPEARRRLV